MAVESSEAGSVDFSRLDAVQELLDENRYGDWLAHAVWSKDHTAKIKR